MTSKLTQQKRSVMNEYAMQVAALMGRPKQFEWIADIQENSDLDVLEVGEGWMFFGWTELQVIIDKLDVWIEKYGSREAVAERIEAWTDWWLGDNSNIKKEQDIVDIWESRRQHYLRTIPRVNLKEWLMGAPIPSDEEDAFERRTRLKVERELLMRYISEHGGYMQLRDLLYEVEKHLEEASKEADALDEQLRQEFLNSEGGKKYMDALKEAIENETKF